MDLEFIKFPKIPRFINKQDVMVITEKIDGTNSQIVIQDNKIVGVGSRNRWITPGEQTDHYGFARWVQDNEEELLKLGGGTHYGEWYGKGIQSGYGLEAKHFAVFNTWRPVESLPACVQQVPILYTGEFSTEKIKEVFYILLEYGSKLNRYTYVKPEGIIVNHLLTKQKYKLTYEYGKGKWGVK